MDDETIAERKRQEIYSITFISIYSIGLAIMIIIAFKVIKLTKCRNVRVFSLMILINLTLIAHIFSESYWLN